MAARSSSLSRGAVVTSFSPSVMLVTRPRRRSILVPAPSCLLQRFALVAECKNAECRVLVWRYQGTDAEVPKEHRARRLTGAEAFRAHATLLVGLALCGLAFWFELGRAEGGNELSWAYVFEWPLLSVFAVYMWWNVLDPDRQSRVKLKKTKQLAPEFTAC